jgi:mannose-6-phosphate isomerase-like protein (cupin superfamily)
MPSPSHAGVKTASLREAHGLSVSELATRCSCPPELIDQLERGDLDPALAPLSKIARALGVRLGTLLDDHDVVGPVLTRSGQYKPVTRLSGNGIGSMEFLGLAADKAGRHMDPFMVVVSPGDAPAASSHEGEEFLYVLEGELELEYGTETHRLTPGDSIYYDSIVSHRLRTAGAAPARVLSVVYAPS